MSNQKRTDTVLIWEERMHQWMESGTSLAKWSRKNNFTYSQCIYWKVRLLGAEKKRKNTSKPDGFYEMDTETTTTSSGISIDVQEMKIHLDVDFDSSTLIKCLNLFKGGVC